MSDENTAEAAATETEASTEQTEQPKPSETVDFWKQKAREQEKRAKENAKAAEELSQIRESQKSEAEKTADRIKQLETETEAARRDALRFKVAAEYGIASERAELLLTGSDEDTMRRQADALKGESEERKKQGNRAPNEGATSPTSAGDERQFVRQLFASAD